MAANPQVDAVNIGTPNFLHRDMGVAMAQAGKHIWIEKPVGLTMDDAKAVADAVRAAGVQAAVGFNYRNAPAVAAAREMITGGQLGTVTLARFRLQRLRRASRGSADLAVRAGAWRQRGAG